MTYDVPARAILVIMLTASCLPALCTSVSDCLLDCHAASPTTTVVYDINGREAVEVEPVLKGTKSSLEQYIYCSSAGVYLKNDMMPHREEDAVDPKSRHKVAEWVSETCIGKSGRA